MSPNRITHSRQPVGVGVNVTNARRTNSRSFSGGATVASVETSRPDPDSTRRFHFRLDALLSADTARVSLSASWSSGATFQWRVAAHARMAIEPRSVERYGRRESCRSPSTTANLQCRLETTRLVADLRSCHPVQDPVVRSPKAIEWAHSLYTTVRGVGPRRPIEQPAGETASIDSATQPHGRARHRYRPARLVGLALPGNVTASAR
jgi:hypothetical protein